MKKILTGEDDIAEMAIEYASATPKYNADICADLCLTPSSDGYVAIG